VDLDIANPFLLFRPLVKKLRLAQTVGPGPRSQKLASKLLRNEQDPGLEAVTTVAGSERVNYVKSADRQTDRQTNRRT